MEQAAGLVDVMFSLGLDRMVYRPYMITRIFLGAWSMSGLVGREVLNRGLFC